MPKPRQLTEDCELIKFFEWLFWQQKKEPILEVVFHTENEKKCSKYAGYIRKQKGVRAGIPDIVNPIPVNPYNGLVIEMKSETGRTSEDQKRIMEIFHGIGWCVRVARSGDEAIKIFQEYMRGSK